MKEKKSVNLLDKVNQMLAKNILEVVFNKDARLEFLKECTFRAYIGNEEKPVFENDQILLKNSLVRNGSKKYVPLQFHSEKNGNIQFISPIKISEHNLIPGTKYINSYVIEITYFGQKEYIIQNFLPELMGKGKSISIMYELSL